MDLRAHRGASLAAVGAGLAIALAGAAARAERPQFASGAEPLTHDGELGHVRVHYVTTSSDAVPDDDADQDGTPDYVEEVAELAELTWEDVIARGFRPPVADADLVADDGGDGRFDIYLVDLTSADGNFVAEACTEAPEPVHCTGYFAMENDLAGFGYGSRTEGISVLTSHEMFHAVQSAYTPDTATAWSEGTAVWNEEQTFPDQDDYERLVPAFLSRTYRPFDRAGGGFGDAYVYGAALWPTFLDERYGDGVVRRTWEASEVAGPGADFLAAVDEVLGEDGESLAAAWTEFSRWNLFTGERADPDSAYADAAELGQVTLEAELVGVGETTTSIEGMSARYLPIASPGDDLWLSGTTDDGVVAAFFPDQGDGSLGPGIDLERDGDVVAAPLPAAGRGILVVTGVQRGGLPRDVEIGVAPRDPGAGDGSGDESEDSGCQAARSGSGRVPGTVALLLAALVLSFRRRRRATHHGAGGSQ